MVAKSLAELSHPHNSLVNLSHARDCITRIMELTSHEQARASLQHAIDLITAAMIGITKAEAERIIAEEKEVV